MPLKTVAPIPGHTPDSSSCYQSAVWPVTQSRCRPPAGQHATYHTQSPSVPAGPHATTSGKDSLPRRPISPITRGTHYRTPVITLQTLRHFANVTHWIFQPPPQAPSQPPGHRAPERGAKAMRLPHREVSGQNWGPGRTQAQPPTPR